MSRLLTFAVPEEAAPFMRLKLDGVRVLVTGMGVDAAQRGIRTDLDSGTPDLVVTAGFCGGLNPTLERGTVVVDRESDLALLATAEEVGIQSVGFHCADRVAVTASEKEILFLKTKRDVVEMESGVIASVCRERGIPVVTIRVVSDPSDEDLPLDFNKLITSKGGIHFGRLALELVKRPNRIPRLMRLGKNTKDAGGKLAEALVKFLEKQGKCSGGT